jgi:hypothetical protein
MASRGASFHPIFDRPPAAPTGMSAANLLIGAHEHSSSKDRIGARQTAPPARGEQVQEWRFSRLAMAEYPVP